MKLISIILSILLAFGACATAEPAAETITGVVTEYVHGQYMVIENAQLGIWLPKRRLKPTAPFRRAITCTCPLTAR